MPQLRFVSVTLGWVALVAAIGWLDYLTGPDYGFGFFYLIAVLPAAWLHGRTVGIIVALAASIAWFGADLAVRPTTWARSFGTR